MEVKVRIGNRKVIETKQGSLEMRMGQGKVKVRVPVWGCTECDTQVPLDKISNKICFIAHIPTKA